MRILVPLINRLSFIDRDVATLRQEHDVDVVSVAGWSIVRCLRQVLWADIVFCWFASRRFLPVVLLARLLGRKIIVIAGGYDVADQPAIGYGNMRTRIGRVLGRLLLHVAHTVSSYSESGASEVAANGGIPRARQRMVYLGFASPAGSQRHSVAKGGVVLTVARINRSTLDRKGLRLVARTAAYLRNYRFIVAGRYDSDAAEVLHRESCGQVELPGYVADEELMRLYKGASVYLQPSYHEAFGCAVAEAMLWGCVPVVSDRYSLPEVVGKAGYYVSVDSSPQEIATVVKKAVLGPPPDGESPRDRILRCFPEGRRSEQLLALVAELSSDGRSSPHPGANATVAC